MPAHLRVPRVVRAPPQGPGRPQRRPGEMAGSLLLAAVLNGGPRPQPSLAANLGSAPGGADGLCCMGGEIEFLKIGLFFTGWLLLIAPLAVAEGTYNLVRDCFRKPKRENVMTELPRRREATEHFASVSTSPPPWETTGASAHSRKSSLSTESSGLPASSSQAPLPNVLRQTLVSSTAGSAAGQRREEEAFHPDERDVLCDKALKWAGGAFPAVSRRRSGGTTEAAAAPPAWLAWLDPAPLRALWAAATKCPPEMDTVLEVMESLQPCGEWRQPYREIFESFLRDPSNPAFEENMLRIWVECWTAVEVRAHLCLGSLQEEYRKLAGSYVRMFFIGDAVATTPAAAVQVIAAVCDVYRAAVGLKRGEEAARQFLDAMAQAPASRPEWARTRGSRCSEDSFMNPALSKIE